MTFHAGSFDGTTFDPATFDGMWSALEPIGREASTGGYRRFAWSRADMTLREWFAGAAAERGLDLVTDLAGNQWAWWGGSRRCGSRRPPRGGDRLPPRLSPGWRSL